jgi:hypothetical protein
MMLLQAAANESEAKRRRIQQDGNDQKFKAQEATSERKIKALEDANAREQDRQKQEQEEENEDQARMDAILAMKKPQ